MTHAQRTALGARLGSALPYIREGAFLADIGTDHAYLPIALCQMEKIKGAVAADIAEGPLAIAARHIREVGLEHSIAVCLSNGLDKIEPYHPTDITVFGMGGELIADIIGRAPFTRSPDIRLILGPMTKQAELRAFLCREGYAIIGESLCREEGRIYQTVCAEYDGKVRSLSPLALQVGKKNLESPSPLLSELLAREQATLEKIIRGKQSAGADCRAELALLAEIEQYRKENLS